MLRIKFGKKKNKKEKKSAIALSEGQLWINKKHPDRKCVVLSTGMRFKTTIVDEKKGKVSKEPTGELEATVSMDGIKSSKQFTVDELIKSGYRLEKTLNDAELSEHLDNSRKYSSDSLKSAERTEIIDKALQKAERELTQGVTKQLHKQLKEWCVRVEEDTRRYLDKALSEDFSGKVEKALIRLQQSEQHLKEVPFNTPLKELQKYLDGGYRIIAATTPSDVKTHESATGHRRKAGFILMRVSRKQTPKKEEKMPKRKMKIRIAR